MVANQDLEKCTTRDRLDMCIDKIVSTCSDISNSNVRVTEDLFSIADYRRWFLDIHNDKADVLIQGESDALLPKQTFTVLDLLHQQVKDTTPKYISTFGINKMWDESWKPLEHIDFTDKPFIHNDETNWWSIRYTMTKEEMNSFNDKVDQLQIVNVKPHKFNGCGFVISSEAVKAGVNIPKGTFFIDDTALQNIARKLLPEMPQYHFKNILIVHNRKHPNKRCKYIEGEQNIDYIDDKRKSTNWYNIANEYSKINDARMFDPGHKFFTWNDVFSKINKN